MSSVKDKLNNMFTKIMAGTVTREEGTLLINHLIKEDQAATVAELACLIESPPPGVFPKTILHTIALTRNKALQSILMDCLSHKDEEISELAAEELAKLRTAEAREALNGGLSSEAGHVRRASATALVQWFTDGVETVRKGLLEHEDPSYRSTYAEALVKSGKKGVETLLSIMATGEPGAVFAAAEALISAGDGLNQGDIQKVFDALLTAGDRKDAQAIVEILRVAASLKERAKGFEGFVMAFADHPAEEVRKEAKEAIGKIRS